MLPPTLHWALGLLEELGEGEGQPAWVRPHVTQILLRAGGRQAGRKKNKATNAPPPPRDWPAFLGVHG